MLFFKLLAIVIKVKFEQNRIRDIFIKVVPTFILLFKTLGIPLEIWN